MTSLYKWWNKWRRRANRTVPSNRLIVLLLLFAALNFVLSNWLLTALWFWLGLVGFLAVVALVDLVSFTHLRLQVERKLPARPQLHVPFILTGSVVCTPSTVRIESVDTGLPQTLASQSAVTFTKAGSALQFTQRVLPIRRGLHKVAQMDWQIRSRFGLWQRLVKTCETQQVLVVPDLTSWRHAVVAMQQTLSQEGSHVRRLHTGDSDFSHLADYVVDDDPRRINWAASARRQRLMKNVYQAEQGQQILIAVDASRYMQVAFANGKTRLDYALECAAALASTALHTGDRVGVMAFTHKMLFQIPPRRGPEHWRLIVEQLAALEAETVQGGYETLLRHLRGSFHRRSLLIIVSELEGVESDAAFLGILSRVQRQHPTLFVTLADTEARDRLREVPAKTGDVPRIAGARWVLQDRSETRAELLRKGVSIVESLPGDVAVDAVAAYLRGRLRLTR